MSKLDDILEAHTWIAHKSEDCVQKQDIKTLILDLIGDDEAMEDSQVLNYKAELRDEIKAL